MEGVWHTFWCPQVAFSQVRALRCMRNPATARVPRTRGAEQRLLTSLAECAQVPVGTGEPYFLIKSHRLKTLVEMPV